MDPAKLVAASLVLPVLSAVWMVYGAARGLRSLVPLPEAPRALPRWPRVSLVVPACNEADTLEEATRAKLASDYPDLEVILVDDRSTDGTAAIVDRLAASDPRVRALHIEELPEGWLGKVHALHRGAAVATGEWLLFSDADVHMSPGLLRRVVGEAEERRLDFVSLFPHFWSTTFFLDVVLASFLRIIVAAARGWEVSNPRSPVASGAGFFNLARRSVLDRTPGLAWLKLEILDDQALAQMMKRAGARCLVFHAPDGVGLRYYRSLREMMHGFEKNGYAVLGQHRPLLTLLAASFGAYVELMPVAALGSPYSWARVAGGLVLLALAASQLAVARAARTPLASALVPVVGPVCLLVFCVRAAVLAHARGGIVWRGTRYRLSELREGRRLEMF